MFANQPINAGENQERARQQHFARTGLIFCIMLLALSGRRKDSETSTSTANSKDKRDEISLNDQIRFRINSIIYSSAKESSSLTELEKENLSFNVSGMYRGRWNSKLDYSSAEIDSKFINVGDRNVSNEEHIDNE